MQQMQVERSAIQSLEISDFLSEPLAEGQARLSIERLALTANTITYAAAGEMMKYWEFFPIDREGWGLVPAWGFAVVTESMGPFKVGDRYYGFWPMANSVVVLPDKVRQQGFVDASAHRTSLPHFYNIYSTAPTDDVDDLRALLQPLLITSYLIDDYLIDNDVFGAEQVIISSASSKTGTGLARFLSAHKPNGPKIIGLTGSANVEFCEELGFYDQVISYDRLTHDISQRPSVFVDMAGNAEIRFAIHQHLSEHLKYSCSVGMSHFGKLGTTQDLPGVKPKLFFAPSWAEKRRQDWGSSKLASNLDASWRETASSSAGWLTVKHHDGLGSVPSLWSAFTKGTMSPDAGHIIVLSSS